MSNKNVYIINNESFARTINTITGIRYKKEPDYHSNRNIFVFENTTEFKKALTYVNNCIKNYKNN